jgi:hypothetical protein
MPRQDGLSSSGPGAGHDSDPASDATIWCMPAHSFSPRSSVWIDREVEDGRMRMRIDSNPFIVSDNSLAQIYKSAGYDLASDYLSRPGLVTRSFPPGVFGFFAYGEEGALVGFVRVFSDNNLCSWIAEMCVCSDQNANAVRSALLCSLIEQFGHTAIYTEAFEDEIEAYQAVGIIARSRLTALSRAPKVKV